VRRRKQGETAGLRNEEVVLCCAVLERCSYTGYKCGGELGCLALVKTAGCSESYGLYKGIINAYLFCSMNLLF
jgi:hypothetical protein